MNCANHPDRERVAFCQNCGKPVCGECVRNVATSVFCEPCLTARVTGAGGYNSGIGYYPVAGPPVAPGEPSPGLAAVLGFIPGVGAMYNGQYAKGIVHLIVFAALASLASNVNGIFLLFVFGWEFYMAFEAYDTARARRDGTPLPNPFGLNDIAERLGFSKPWPGSEGNESPTDAAQQPPSASPAADGGTSYSSPDAYFHRAPDGSQTYAVPGVPPVPPYAPSPPMPGTAEGNERSELYHRRFPTGAIWLIALGIFFLVGNSGFFPIFNHRLLWPILLIGFGVWLFVDKMIGSGHSIENDGTEFYRWRLSCAMRGSFWVVLIGAIWLLDALGILSWGRSWPLFLIALGAILLFNRTLNGGFCAYPRSSSGASAGQQATGSGNDSGGETRGNHDTEQEGR